MTDWRAWHGEYEQSGSSLSRRLVVVRRYIDEALLSSPPGPIRVISMCAGDGRDLLGVLPDHVRGPDVVGRLVELDPEIGHRATAAAPLGIDVACEDAGVSDSYIGATPADLLLCCGIFGNVSERDIRETIGSWPMLCRKGATVIWTRGASDPDQRETIRSWAKESGFEEVAFDGDPEKYGVGMARMTREPLPLLPAHRFFEFLPEKVHSNGNDRLRPEQTARALRARSAEE